MPDNSRTFDLSQYLQRVHKISYSSPVIPTFLIYDHLIFIDDEVNLIWRSNGKLGKVFYLVARYGPYADLLQNSLRSVPSLISQHWCEQTYVSLAWFSFIAIAFTEVILLLRTWVLWNRDLRIGVPLLMFMGACFGVCTYFMARSLASPTYMDPEIFLMISRCPPPEGNKLLFMNYVILALLETVVFVLTMVAGFVHYRHGFELEGSLIQSLLRDGILYYSILLGTITTTIFLATDSNYILKALSIANLVAFLYTPLEFAHMFAEYVLYSLRY
ncbi:hypothetical protein NLI96_g8701 [Meripilus lineatus]|uniref:DUF6533 domain-containing protein n=1 Tax=Meripilus lineatus TaxID=2056292 RepID=A0AAD5UWW3_9APHY|nr:hypothetical protein NLI96_g8701 [Physisporinus lineatus]